MGEMKRLPIWFWIAVVYLVATVSLNVFTQWRSFPFYPLTDKLTISANLILKVLAIVVLIIRQKIGVYFLGIAFIIGLASTIWGFYIDGSWQALPTLSKIGRVNGFVISGAIVVYMNSLRVRGLLNGRRDSNSDPSVASTFS